MYRCTYIYIERERDRYKDRHGRRGRADWSGVPGGAAAPTPPTRHCYNNNNNNDNANISNTNNSNDNDAGNCVTQQEHTSTTNNSIININSQQCVSRYMY